MATLDLGNIVIDDAIVAKIQDAFGQTSLAQLRAVARLLVRRYLREEAIRRYRLKLESEDTTLSETRQAQEQAQIEAGWPSP